jgi:hypothetical protein
VQGRHPFAFARDGLGQLFRVRWGLHMKEAVVEIGVNEPPLNAISLKCAVLCANCDVISDSPHDLCRVCGSRSLFNISRMLGGTLPRERAMLVAATAPTTLRHPVLTFPRPPRTQSSPRRVKSG